MSLTFSFASMSVYKKMCGYICPGGDEELRMDIYVLKSVGTWEGNLRQIIWAQFQNQSGIREDGWQSGSSPSFYWFNKNWMPLITWPMLLLSVSASRVTSPCRVLRYEPTIVTIYAPPLTALVRAAQARPKAALASWQSWGWGIFAEAGTEIQLHWNCKMLEVCKFSYPVFQFQVPSQNNNNNVLMFGLVSFRAARRPAELGRTTRQTALEFYRDKRSR